VRVSAFALMVCLAAPPSLGWADQTAAPAAAPEVVATAAGAPAAPPQADASSLSRWLRDAPPVNGLGGQDQDGVIQLRPDRRIHGEVGFGIGTGGYRDAFAAVNMPVGETGRLGVAVQDTQYGKPWRSEFRSLDVNLALGGAASAPRDCGSTIRVGDRFVQPLWVSRFRDSPLDDVDPRCVGDGAPRR
jgi:hypothetical protein